MLNELVRIGPIVVHGYGVMIALGVLAAFAVTEFRITAIAINTGKSRTS